MPKEWREETSADWGQHPDDNLCSHQCCSRLRTKTQERCLLGLPMPTNTHAYTHTVTKTHDCHTHRDLTFTKKWDRFCFTNDRRMHWETSCWMRVLSSVPACSCGKSDYGTRFSRRWLSHPSYPGPHTLTPALLREAGPSDLFLLVHRMWDRAMYLSHKEWEQLSCSD